MNNYRKLWTVFVPAGVLVVSLALAACSSDSSSTPVFDLNFTGTGYGPHTGQTIRVAVLTDPGGTEVAGSAVLVPADGTFSFPFTGVLSQGTAYNLDYFADSDAGAGTGTPGNGVCDAPPTDHAWRVPIPAVTGIVNQAEVHNTNFTDVCASFRTGLFDLVFSGTGYAPHDGQTIRVALVTDPGGTTVATTSVLMTAAGTFSFTFTGVLTPGTAYNLDYYADSDVGAGSGIDGNGVCDAPPTDHAWRVPIPSVTADVIQAEVHNTNFTDVCASFP